MCRLKSNKHTFFIKFVYFLTFTYWSAIKNNLKKKAHDLFVFVVVVVVGYFFLEIERRNKDYKKRNQNENNIRED